VSRYVEKGPVGGTQSVAASLPLPFSEDALVPGPASADELESHPTAVIRMRTMENARGMRGIWR
jgi:hypothetical protein